jgi:uncharacterized protein (TIGR02421 family)
MLPIPLVGCSMRADAPSLAGPVLDFSGDGPLRKRLLRGGRAHVDRPLPFLILNRHVTDSPRSLAHRVAQTASAYVVWPEQADCDDEALAAIVAIAARARATFDRVLLVSLYDLSRDETLDDEAARLEQFSFRISASGDEAGQAAALCLAKALAALEVDLRQPDIADVAQAWFEPGLEELFANEAWLSHLSLGVPQNYRVPGEPGIYPQLLHDLTVGIFDALLQAFQAFLAHITPGPVPHHRAFGRSSFIAAAKTVDRKLDAISSDFDFLLSISPINTGQAFDQFKASKYRKPPTFRYRPLTVDPDFSKRRLYAIDFHRVEDPVLEALFAEKRREIDQQLTMLQTRNTSAFRYASLVLYGPVKSQLLEAAKEILANVGWDRAPTGEGDMVGAPEIREAAQRTVARYRAGHRNFTAQIALREDIAAGLMVSGGKLYISASTRMRGDRLDALLQHEISVHLLTYFNGSAQGLKIFRTGLAGYEGIQEGLGVFAEYAVGGLTRSRLRLLAARVLVVHAMIDGASFTECFDLLRDIHGFGARTAFNIVARVYRSGGLTKDAIYLRGFSKVIAMLAAGEDLGPFWFGKIAAAHVPVVRELELRGLLHRPRFTPEFLARPEAEARIAELRHTSSLSKLI